VVEPAVLGALVRRGADAARPAVTAVVQPDLAWHAVAVQPVPPLREGLGVDVPVVQPVDDEDARPDPVDVVEVVARLPERAPVAGHAILRTHEERDGPGAAVVHAAAADERSQDVRVLAEEFVLPDTLGL
jgi:hypothetical protein